MGEIVNFLEYVRKNKHRYQNYKDRSSPGKKEWVATIPTARVLAGVGKYILDCTEESDQLEIIPTELYFEYCNWCRSLKLESVKKERFFLMVKEFVQCGRMKGAGAPKAYFLRFKKLEDNNKLLAK